MKKIVIRCLFTVVLVLSTEGCANVETLVAPNTVLGAQGISLTQRLDPALITVDNCVEPPPAAPMTLESFLRAALTGQAQGEMLAQRIAEACPAFSSTLITELNKAGVDYRLAPSTSSNAEDFPEAKYRIEISSPFEYADYENNGTTWIAAVSVTVWNLKSGKFIGVATIKNSHILNLAHYAAIGITGSRCAVGYISGMFGCNGFTLVYRAQNWNLDLLGGDLPPE